MPAERFVLDASVAVEGFLPSGGPGGRYAEGILERIGGEELVPAVPDLWHYELGAVALLDSVMAPVPRDEPANTFFHRSRGREIGE